MAVRKVKANPTNYTAIQWRGDNERDIRSFILDDSALNFRDEGLRVWNEMDKSWIECPVFHWLVVDEKKNILPYSPEEFDKKFSEDQAELEKPIEEAIKEIDTD